MTHDPQARTEALIETLRITLDDAIDDTFGGFILPGTLTDGQWRLLALDLEERLDAREARTIRQQSARTDALTPPQVLSTAANWLA